MRRAALAAPLAIMAVAGGCKADAEPVGGKTPAACAGAAEIALTGRVNDAANILSAEQETRLSARLARYEKHTTHQIAIATAPDLKGIDVGDFGDCLGNRWGIGHRDRDDGVLILVAPNERRVRISTGTGMEDMLTDEEARTVIDQMTPYFRSLDYAGGLSVGVEAIAVQTGEPR